LELLLHTPEITMGKCKEGKKAHHWYVSNLVKNMGWLGWAGEGVSSWTLEEQLKLLFTWGLGVFSNNQAKAYALWKGLKISKGSCAQSLVVVRDSNTIINHMEFIVL
jgi:ribonuclease HI